VWVRFRIDDLQKELAPTDLVDVKIRSDPRNIYVIIAPKGADVLPFLTAVLGGGATVNLGVEDVGEGVYAAKLDELSNFIKRARDVIKAIDNKYREFIKRLIQLLGQEG